MRPALLHGEDRLVLPVTPRQCPACSSPLTTREGIGEHNDCAAAYGERSYRGRVHLRLNLAPRTP